MNKQQLAAKIWKYTNQMRQKLKQMSIEII